MTPPSRSKEPRALLDAFNPATRSAGLAHMEAFAPHMGSAYAQMRNFDFGPDDCSHTSCLSPYVRHRLVLERELAQAALDMHGPQQCEKFLQEVFWRTYWKGWLEMRPQVWSDYCSVRDDALSKTGQDDSLSQRYTQAINGETGITCFDAWAQQLIEYGYLHNHARMWFASIWIFTLNLPWVLGADHFLRHLLDGDAASNTLSWRWVGGLQTRGKTYLSTPSNIAKFTDGRFEVLEGVLAGSAPALDWQDPPSPKMPALNEAAPNVPYRLFLHEEDGCFETLSLESEPSEVLVQALPVARGPGANGVKTQSFTQAALDDVYDRAKAHFRCEVRRIELVDLSAEKGLVAPHIPIGPLRSAMQGMAMITREEDAFLWPYATKGFFKFKDAIPKVIDVLGLGGS